MNYLLVSSLIKFVISSPLEVGQINHLDCTLLRFLRSLPSSFRKAILSLQSNLRLIHE